MKHPILIAAAFALLPASLFSDVGRPNLSAPAFRDAFRQSYLAVSTAEPEVTDLEKAILDKVGAMIFDQPEQAKTVLQDILSEGKPVSAAFNHALGNLYYESGQLLKSEIEYMAAITKYPNFRRGWNGLGLARFKLNDYDKALEALSKSVQLGSNDALTYGALGYCHLQLGNLKSAEVAYNLAILNDPKSIEWSEGMAQIYMESERFDEAEGIIRQMLKLKPGQVSYWLVLANAALGKGESLRAARSLEIARQFGPLNSGALYLLGNIYLKHQLYDRAKETFLAGMAIDKSEDKTTHLNAIRYLINSGESELARELFQSVGEPVLTWSRENKANYNVALAEFNTTDNDSDKAIAAYTRSLEFEPFNGLILVKLAQLQAEAGRTDLAMYLLERARKDPKYGYGALVYQAKLLIDQSRIKETLPLIEEAMRLSPSATLSNLHSQIRKAIDLLDAK